MAFSSTWPCGGKLIGWPDSAEKETFKWDIRDFLEKCREERESLATSEKKLKTADFSFAGATWNFFFCVDQQDFHSQFGINVRAHRAMDFECDCDISFEGYEGDTIKELECTFKCEDNASQWTREDIFSDSELENLLRTGCFIFCKILINKSSIKEECSRTEINDLSCGTVTVKANEQTQCLENDSSEFLGSIWPLGGELYREQLSAFEIDVTCTIWSFLQECKKARKESGENNRKLKTAEFSFGDATFNFVVSVDAKKSQSLFGINFRTRISSAEVYECCTNIASKNFKCEFKSGAANSHWTATDFLTDSELEKFLNTRGTFRCRISRKEGSTKDDCLLTEISRE